MASGHKKWTYTSSGKSAEPTIRLAAWQDIQQVITQKLEPLINQGWESLGEFGPGSINIEWENLTDSITHFFYGVPGKIYREASASQRTSYLFSCRLFGILFLYAILILVTAGLALIPIAIYHGVMHYAAPIRFQLKLRRRKQPNQSI